MDKETEIYDIESIIYDGLLKNDGKTFDVQAILIADDLRKAGYRKADEVRKETAKEIWEDMLGIIDEGYHRPQVNTTISSPFMNGENCAYKVVIVRMKQALKEKYGVEVDE